MRESETETGGIIGSSRSLAPRAMHQDLKIEEASAVTSWSWGLEKPQDRPSQTGGPWEQWPPQVTSANNGQEPQQICFQSQGPHSRTREPGIIRDWSSFTGELALASGFRDWLQCGVKNGEGWKWSSEIRESLPWLFSRKDSQPFSRMTSGLGDGSAAFFASFLWIFLWAF